MNTAQATVREESAQSNALSGAETASTTDRSLRGAIDPGVHSIDPVIEGRESPEKWIAHRDIVVGELNPVGALETLFAERAAMYLWRLERVVHYEVIATRDDMEDLVEEFLVSLDNPDLVRDRSESVTLEKLRGPLSKLLAEFSNTCSLENEHGESNDDVETIRRALKLVLERRILPDQSTLQTIIKYEAHLDRCLARTMAELRRLQKERRQGLRNANSGGRGAERDGVCQNQQIKDGSPGGSPSRDSSPSRKSDCADMSIPGGRGADRADRSTSNPASLEQNIIRLNEDDQSKGSCERNDSSPRRPDEPNADLHADSTSRINATDRIVPPIPNVAPQTKTGLNGYFVSESTPNGIVTRDRNASGTTVTMFPPAQFQAIPNIIVRPAPIPVSPQKHQKE